MTSLAMITSMFSSSAEAFGDRRQRERHVKAVFGPAQVGTGDHFCAFVQQVFQGFQGLSDALIVL